MSFKPILVFIAFLVVVNARYTVERAIADAKNGRKALIDAYLKTLAPLANIRNEQD